MTRQFLPEWQPQSAVLLTWPHQHSSWVSYLPEIEQAYIDMVSAIAPRQQALINCYDQAHQQHIKQLLQHLSAYSQHIHYFIVPTNDTWVRDYGPLSIVADGKLQLINFAFNGWGNKYKHDLDHAAVAKLEKQHAFNDVAVKHLDIILEGGGIETDGLGTLMATSRCLLAKTRNPTLSKKQFEQILNQELGIDHVLWLEHGYLEGDDTDGHVDMMARFIDPQTICYIHCDDQNDDHFPELNALYQELKNLRDRHGNPYRLIPLPFPKPRFDEDGKRLPLSYVNFLIINDAILMPIYNDVADEQALAQIKKCFPARDIITIRADVLIQQYGSIHCATMQIARI